MARRALTILNSEIEENVARYGGGIQVTLASTLVVRESKLTRNRCNWDGCAIGLGDLGFLVEMTKGAEALAQVATNPKVQLLDVQIEHECNMGRYSPRGNGDWGQGPWRGIVPVFSYGKGRALDYHWNEFLVPPVAAGPNILEFDTPLDIRNLRVATTGCDEIANHEPCSDAVVEQVHTFMKERMYDAYYGELEGDEEPTYPRGKDYHDKVLEQILPRCHPEPCDCSCHETPNGAPAYSVPRAAHIMCQWGWFVSNPMKPGFNKGVGCYNEVYEKDVPDLNPGAPEGALILQLIKPCAPDGSDGDTCCAEFASNKTIFYHGPVQPGYEFLQSDDDDEPPQPRHSFCYGHPLFDAEDNNGALNNNLCFAPPAQQIYPWQGWNGTFPTYAGTCCNHVPDDGTWTDNDATILGLPHHALPTCSDGKVVGAASGELESICGGEALCSDTHVFGYAPPSPPTPPALPPSPPPSPSTPPPACLAHGNCTAATLAFLNGQQYASADCSGDQFSSGTPLRSQAATRRPATFASL